MHGRRKHGRVSSRIQQRDQKKQLEKQFKHLGLKCPEKGCNSILIVLTISEINKKDKTDWKTLRCDQCDSKIANKVSLHCSNTSNIHKHGYDLCAKCGSGMYKI